MNKAEKHTSTFRVAIVSALIGSIVGAILTFFLPHLWNYFISPPATLNTTPQELISWYKKIDHDVQAQALAKDQYYGKWVRWTGTITDISAFPANKATLRFDTFSAFCDTNIVRNLSVGVRVTILGKVRNISAGHVLLDDCKVDKIHRKNAQ